MTTDMPTRTPYQQIDLYDFCSILWKSKFLILAITAIAIAIAAAYTFFAPAVYIVSARLLPPTIQDLANYNLAAQITSRGYEAGYRNPAAPDNTQIEKLAPGFVYNEFLRNLNSATAKLKFFNDVYLPAHGDNTNESEKQALLTRMEKELKIKLPDNAQDPATLVTLQGHDPQVTASLVNKYVTTAVNMTKAGLIKDLDAQVKTRSIAVDSQINAYQQIMHTELKSHGNENSKELQPDEGGMRASDIGNATFRNLLTQKTLLSRITLDPSDFSVIDIDHVADASMATLKSPKKLLAMIIGVVFGFMLGILVAVIRRPFTT